MNYKIEVTEADKEILGKLFVGLTHGSESEEDKNECFHAVKGLVQFHSGIVVPFSEAAPFFKSVFMALDCAEDWAPQIGYTPADLRKSCIKVITQAANQDPKLGDRMTYWAEMKEEQCV